MVGFNIRSLLEDVLSPFYQAARSKDVDLSIQVAPDVPEILTGDSWCLGQIIANLVDNAIKLTASGQVCVTLRTFEIEHQDEDAVHLFCEVRDTGVGIPTEVQAGIFGEIREIKPGDWHSEDAECKLRLTRKLVEHMGCHLALASTLGRGSTFWFRVLMAKGSAPSPTEARQSEATGMDRHRKERDSDHFPQSHLSQGCKPSPGGKKGASIDETALNRIRGFERGSPNLLVSLIDRFLAEAPTYLAQIREAVCQNAWTELHHASHLLRSSSEVLGARLLADLCQYLESGSEACGVPDASTVLARIESEFGLVCDALSAWRER